MFFEPIISIAVTTLSATLLTLLKSFLDKNKSRKDEQEVSDEVKKSIDELLKLKKEEKTDDVLTLMIRNVAELREYYIINKQQARSAFSSALFISILGFILFASGIVLSYFYKDMNTIQYSTIAGVIVELIAGLFFWLYSKAINQINIFHTSLLRSEKFLTAIQLTEKISEPHRDGMYSYIISNIISSHVRGEVGSQTSSPPNPYDLKNEKKEVEFSKQ